MKKIIIILLFAIFIFTSCDRGKNINDPINENVILTGKIIEINNTSVLLANMSEDANISDIYWLNAAGISMYGKKNEELDYTSLQNGMIINVEFDGAIQESFPMGFSKVYSVRVVEQKDDLVNFYLGVIDDLYNTDEGLNHGISIMVFDLTEVINLTETEKTALIYLADNVYKMESMAGTFESLSEQGYIDKEKLYFESGLLFTLKDSKIGGKNFKFDAQKWRSGLGAYYFSDCVANKKGDRWTYKIGVHMIS